MNNEEFVELVKSLDIIAHDLSNENKTASECVALGAKSLREMNLVIQLLKAKVGLLEFKVGF